MAVPTWPTIPAFATDSAEFLRAVAIALRNCVLGKLNCYLEVTLTASTTTTTVTDARIHPDCVLLFDPLTANAAAELGAAAGSPYVLAANRTLGQAVITHANAGTTDRTYRMLILS